MIQSLRLANINDVAELVAIDQACFMKNLAFNYFQFNYAIQKGKGKIVVMMNSSYNKLLAYIYLRYMSEHLGKIYSIAVLPAYQGIGIGGELISFASAHFRSHGMKKINLECMANSLDVVRFYKRHGYQVRKILHDYYGLGENGFLMEKFINGSNGVMNHI